MRGVHAVWRHRTVLGVAGKLPTIGEGAFVAPSAALIGDVQVGKGASIWYGTVLRGKDLSLGMHRLAFALRVS